MEQTTGQADDSGAPKPEALSTEGVSSLVQAAAPAPANDKAFKARRGGYRPSHKATFIGLGVIAAILAVNAVVIIFIMRSSAPATEKTQKEVTLSADTLNSLGMNKTAVGNQSAELTVGPNSIFNGTLTVAKDVSIAGKLQLNSKFTAAEAGLGKLEAGDTALSTLNVNGDATVSNLNLRKDLTVPGSSRLQGPVTVSQLLTVNNNVNVTGSLAVGGSLSVHNFQASSLTSDTTLTIGGHILTRGTSPGVTAGSGLGQNGTASISGADAAGTISLGVGTGSGGGLLATVTFAQGYSSTPRVIVTAVGQGMNLYINRNANGFQVYSANALNIGGYAIDYIVMQ